MHGNFPDMDMNAILERISARIDEMNAEGIRTSFASVSKTATGSPDTIRNWQRAVASGKRGGATTTKIGEIARALRVSPDWLLTGEGTSINPDNDIVAEIIDLLPELEPEELRMLRAAARGFRDQRQEEGK
jgi:hypothetical protein